MITQVKIKRMHQEIVTKTVTLPDPVTKLPVDHVYNTYDWVEKKNKTLHFSDSITALKAVKAMSSMKGDVMYAIEMTQIPSTTEPVLSGESQYTFVCEKCAEIFLDIEIAKAISPLVTEYRCVACKNVLATHNKVVN